MQAKPMRSPLLWVPSGYFTMALGYVMLTSVTAIMFKNLGMDNGRAAGYSSLLILAYTIKPLFAPFVEMYRTKKFFVLWAQVLIGAGFAGVALAFSLPGYMTVLMAAFFALSFVGATQDVASDGVYVTSLDARAQSLYCGIQSLSWNIGPIVASGGMVYLSGYLHSHVYGHDARVFGPDWIDAWRVIFLLVAGVTLLMAAWHARTMPDGARAADTPSSVRDAGRILLDAFVTLFRKRGIWRMLAFAFLFRLSIGLLEKIGPFFMVDPASKGGLGMSNELLGLVYGTYGLAAVLVGSLLGGWYVARRGLKATLFVLCCAVNIPNVTFLLMSIYLPSSLFVIAAGVVIEKFFFGFGAVGFMIYLMQQLAPGKYTTTHYAFGTGVMGLCGMVTGVVSGHLQEMLGYVSYFAFVMVATIPSFIATWCAPFHQADPGAVAIDADGKAVAA
ncbi:AmpG family muropeptide MFS transporter [Massilia sp. Dwa41.01b]|uniref:MFS transporter n=1 Tax=unclassified Massilia TaxID=2609279 RepID=UPI0015FF6787|nr:MULTISPECIES: MFS transporter [unclassified Massilia]QNA89057.1 AmpG family muropeptide MFS transporter [Massilia sp. Dwa41.01b]QNA99945.1 AmpG family muropeptide MFS transporter [Massilia sp. Se16.2.3]